jgi:hypothetical protein
MIICLEIISSKVIEGYTTVKFIMVAIYEHGDFMLAVQKHRHERGTHRHIMSPYFQLLNSLLDIDFNVGSTTVFKKLELRRAGDILGRCKYHSNTHMCIFEGKTKMYDIILSNM